MPIKETKLSYHRDPISLAKVRRETPSRIPNVLKSAPFLFTESHEALGAVDNHDEIQSIFPSTYGRARVSLHPVETPNPSFTSPIRIAVVLSGGQAPGSFIL